MWFIVLSALTATSALAADRAPANSELQVLPVPVVYPTLPTEAQVHRTPGFHQSGRIATMYMDNLPRGYQVQPHRAINLVSGAQQLGSGTRWMIDGAWVDPMGFGVSAWTLSAPVRTVAGPLPTR